MTTTAHFVAHAVFIAAFPIALLAAFRSAVDQANPIRRRIAVGLNDLYNCLANFLIRKLLQIGPRHIRPDLARREDDFEHEERVPEHRRTERANLIGFGRNELAQE